jgi:glycosyltransferase involved in cell wall biosynthesis
MYIERTEEMIKLSEFYTTKRNFSMRERIIYTATKYLARHADILLFNTSWQLGIWQRAYQFDVARAKVMENEYPPKQISAPPMRKKFIAAGRGIRYKNIPAFAAAFAKVKERYPEIELDTRALPPEEHTERITQCFAVVVPSVSEVNSNFIIEALSYGKPFITTRDSGMDERVRGLGMFIDTARESEMEEAIEAMLDPSIYRGYVRHIDEFSYTHSWKEIAEEILKFAREV